MKIKIYGQKRTGTNLMEYILQGAGHEVHVNSHGWKHGRIPENILSKVDYVVICMRNPAAWLVSNRKHDDFIENANIAEERWTSVEDWAARDASYFWWSKFRGIGECSVIDTMQAITNPLRFWERLTEEGLVSGPMKLPTGKMDMGGNENQSDTFDVDYYRNQEYLEKLTDEDWLSIEKSLIRHADLADVWGTWFNQVRR